MDGVVHEQLHPAPQPVVNHAVILVEYLRRDPQRAGVWQQVHRHPVEERRILLWIDERVVAWGGNDLQALDAALVATATSIIPARHLLAIWERMLFDPRENRRGFPDLVAFGEDAGDYCLIEVKGPGDALQDSQKRWLRFFAAHQIPAQVAWVEWADD